MKSILITGASRGVGRALALACAASGRYEKMILTCRRAAENLADTARLAREAGAPLVLTSVGDLGDLGYVQSLRADLGPVETLVNNAGIAWVGLLTEMQPEEWNRVLTTNLTALFHTCRTYVPDMVAAQHGQILNISSVWGLAGASCEVAYSATKGAVNAFTRALAKELAPSHIQVNAAALGAVDTEMNRHLTAEEKSALADEIPAGRLASPEEIASGLLKLLEMPEYCSGEIIRMDGCWL